MTNKELIEILSQYPDDAQVVYETSSMSVADVESADYEERDNWIVLCDYVGDSV